MMIRQRQHLLVVLAATLLAGCGSAPGSEFIISQAQRQPVTKAASVTKAPAVIHQQSALTITAPESVKGTGAIAMKFSLPQHKGYGVLATVNDINTITVALEQSSFLTTTTLATGTVQKSQIVSNQAAVQFTGLAAGSYIVKIDALDAGGNNIGTDSENVPVTAGQTATCNANLQLINSATGGTPATTSLGVNVNILNGN
ncbi:MAG TPA: hypothetical protein V6D47_00685 [Oscillatoriaceae cyanobacterium]